MRSFIVAAACLAAVAAQAQSGGFIDQGPIANQGGHMMLNDSGQAVFSTNETSYFRNADGSWTDIGFKATALGPDGAVYGERGLTSGYRWSNGETTQVAFNPTAVGDDGTVYGTVNLDLVEYRNGQLTPSVYDQPRNNYVNAANGRYAAVTTHYPTQRGFFYRDGQVVPLSYDWGASSDAVGVSRNGLGIMNSHQYGATVVDLETNRTWALDTIARDRVGPATVFATGVNDNGFVVGTRGGMPGNSSFVWTEAGGMQDLAPLLLDGPVAADIFVNGITNDNYAYGTYITADGIRGTFSAQVVPEPGSMLALAAGAAFFARRRKRAEK